MRRRMMWRIMQVEGGRYRRRWLKSSKIWIILLIIRMLNSIMFFFFIENTGISRFLTTLPGMRRLASKRLLWLFTRFQHLDSLQKVGDVHRDIFSVYYCISSVQFYWEIRLFRLWIAVNSFDVCRKTAGLPRHCLETR